MEGNEVGIGMPGPMAQVQQTSERKLKVTDVISREAWSILKKGMPRFESPRNGKGQEGAALT